MGRFGAEAVKVVTVEWVDSHTGGDWVSVDAAVRTAAEANALRMTSVGYLVADEPEFVLLAGTFSPATSSEKALINNTMQIPRCAIESIKQLPVGRAVAR